MTNKSIDLPESNRSKTHENPMIINHCIKEEENRTFSSKLYMISYPCAFKLSRLQWKIYENDKLCKGSKFNKLYKWWTWHSSRFNHQLTNKESK